MAITKLTFPRSKPTTDGPIDINDYIYQNSHLMAFINQINSQAFILSDPNGTVAPTIKQGAYISHGGSLYIVDTADATISGTPSDGTVYIRVSGTDTLTAEYITDISSYAWNSAYNAMISGSYTLLPYMLIKSGTSWTKYRFEQHKQATGNAIIDGHDIDSELDTLNSRINQDVKTTASPTFAKLTLTTSTHGSQIIGNVDSWVVPAGIYQIPRTGTDITIQVYNGSAWIGFGDLGAVISDGSNVRIRNAASVSQTIYYLKFS